jgi:hypothetical protein
LLVSAEGSASVNGEALEFTYGASNVLESGTVDIVIGSGGVNCAIIAGAADPPSGTCVQIQISEATAGVPDAHMVKFLVVSGNDMTGEGSNGGAIEVLQVSDSTIELAIDYALTTGTAQYSINGTFGVRRCP